MRNIGATTEEQLKAILQHQWQYTRWTTDWRYATECTNEQSIATEWYIWDSTPRFKVYEPERGRLTETIRTSRERTSKKKTAPAHTATERSATERVAINRHSWQFKPGIKVKNRSTPKYETCARQQTTKRSQSRRNILMDSTKTPTWSVSIVTCFLQ